MRVLRFGPHPPHHHLKSWDASYTKVLDGEGSSTIREIYGCAWITAAVQMREEGRSKDIAGSGRIYFKRRVSREVFGYTVLEESRSLPPVGCNQQGHIRRPAH